MPKPPGALGVEARKKSYSLTIPRSSATSKHSVSESPPLRQQGRSACSSASLSPQAETQQLDLLALLEKHQEPALRIELVPVNLTLGVKQRFWLIHQESGLRVPGQFSQTEAEHILQTTEGWNWKIDYRVRTPRCSHRLFCLLSAVCTPPELEVAA